MGNVLHAQKMKPVVFGILLAVGVLLLVVGAFLVLKAIGKENVKMEKIVADDGMVNQSNNLLGNNLMGADRSESVV